MIKWTDFFVQMKSDLGHFRNGKKFTFFYPPPAKSYLCKNLFNIHRHKIGVFHSSLTLFFKTLYIAVAPLRIWIDGFTLDTTPRSQKQFCLFSTETMLCFCPFFQNMMGSGIPCSRIDRFLATQGTHSNEATTWDM